MDLSRIDEMMIGNLSVFYELFNPVIVGLGSLGG